MLNAIDDILYCRYTSVIRTKFLTCKVMEVLFLALDQITGVSLKGPVHLPEIVVRRIYEARQLITRNLARDYSLRELGVLVGLSSYHLKRGFKAIYNLSAADFRHEIRMQKARLILEETDLPITRIAADIGYDHPFAFSSAFKKFFGYTPSLVRKGRRIHTD
jgi:AraC-like DNA-binding protein